MQAHHETGRLNGSPTSSRLAFRVATAAWTTHTRERKAARECQAAAFVREFGPSVTPSKSTAKPGQEKDNVLFSTPTPTRVAPCSSGPPKPHRAKPALGLTYRRPPSTKETKKKIKPMGASELCATGREHDGVPDGGCRSLNGIILDAVGAVAPPSAAGGEPVEKQPGDACGESGEKHPLSSASGDFGESTALSPSAAAGGAAGPSQSMEGVLSLDDLL